MQLSEKLCACVCVCVCACAHLRIRVLVCIPDCVYINSCYDDVFYVLQSMEHDRTYRGGLGQEER